MLLILLNLFARRSNIDDYVKVEDWKRARDGMWGCSPRRDGAFGISARGDGSGIGGEGEGKRTTPTIESKTNAPAIKRPQARRWIRLRVKHTDLLFMPDISTV